MKCAFALLMLLVGTGTALAEVSQPSCDGTNAPELGAPIKVSLAGADRLTDWHPPSGAGWPADAQAKLVVASALSFQFRGSMDDLIARAGQVSELPAISYWSAEDHKSLPLAKDASALSSPNAKDRRNDFTAAEMTVGRPLFYWQDDDLTGQTVYELKVYERGANRAVIGTANVTPVSKSIFTLFEPGASRSALFLERTSPGTFRACILATALQGTSGMVTRRKDVYVERTKALLNYLAEDSSRVASNR